jgi:hypothetical protein
VVANKVIPHAIAMVVRVLNRAAVDHDRRSFFSVTQAGCYARTPGRQWRQALSRTQQEHGADMTRFFRTALLLTAGMTSAMLPLTGAAATKDSLADPDTILAVDGRNYPASVADIMFAAAQSAKKDITWPDFLDGVAENQLMARHAVAEMGRQKLMSPDKVGFPPDIILQDQYLTLVKRHFYKDIDATVRTLPDGSLDKLITRKLPRDDAAVKELMTLRDRGEVRLTPSQLELARKTLLASVTLPDGKTRDISWYDMYARENVQGRTKLMQEGDFTYLEGRLQTRVESLFIAWWMENRSGLSLQEQTTLRTMLEEKYLRETYMLQLGVVSSMHEDLTPALEKMQKTVTRQEVRDWYSTHKEEFRQVEKVRARHIRCATEADCKTALSAIEKGMEFSAAAKKYSIAESRNATPAGSLGWLERNAKNLSWLQQLAMIQHKGEVSMPVRTPEDANGKADWEIILVDERIEGYSNPDGETVRYAAVQEIAKRKLIDQYIKVRDSLKTKADIRRNPALIRARMPKQPTAGI